MTTLSNLSVASMANYLLNNEITVATAGKTWYVECGSDRDELFHSILDDGISQVTCEEDFNDCCDTLEVAPEDRHLYSVVSSGINIILIDNEEWSKTALEDDEVPQPDTIVAFRIVGGGGNNKKSIFIGEMSIYDVARELNCVPTDADDPDAKWETYDGRPIDLTNREAESGIGTIDLDGYYDTYYTKRLGNVSGWYEVSTLALSDKRYLIPLLIHACICYQDI